MSLKFARYVLGEYMLEEIVDSENYLLEVMRMVIKSLGTRVTNSLTSMS